MNNRKRIYEPTSFHDITPAPIGVAPPEVAIPDKSKSERFLYEHTLEPWCAKESAIRKLEVSRVSKHVEISLNSLIDRQQNQLGEYLSARLRHRRSRDLMELFPRLRNTWTSSPIGWIRGEPNSRWNAIAQFPTSRILAERGSCLIRIEPLRNSPRWFAMMRSNTSPFRLPLSTKKPEAGLSRVWNQNRGFDLISRRPHPEDPKTFVEARFIEVKGRAGVGVVALSSNEYTTASRIKADYWLYVVFNCSGLPQLHIIQNPSTLGWQPVMAVEHYQIGPTAIQNSDGRNR